MRAFFRKALIALLLSFNISFVFAQEYLVWQDCLREAKENHPDLISAKESLNQAKANQAITASSLKPQLSSQLSQRTGGSRSDSYYYGLTARQLLFDGFKSSHQVSADQKRVESQKYNYQLISAGVRARVRAAFVELLKAQELLEISKDIFLRREKNLELVQLRYEAGREHKGAVLTAQASLKQAEFEVARSRRQLNLAQRRLSTEMGRKDFSPLKVEGDFSLDYCIEEEPDFKDLVEKNPYSRKLETQKETAVFNLRSSQADFSPQLQASADVGRSALGWPPRENEWSAGVALSFPLFEGGRRIHKVSEAQSRLNQAQAEKRSGKDSLYLELDEAWRNFQDAAQRVGVQKNFFEAVQERAKISQAQYSNGLISFDNWIIIEDDLAAAQKSFLEAKANSLLAENRWVQAKGEAWDE